MASRIIPDIVVGRLPRYLQALLRLQSGHQNQTSSMELGEKLGISPAQIRKDLSHFGGFGKQGSGYSVPFLISQLKDILNVDTTWDIAIVGAGDLGHAIARYQGFGDHGFRIRMIFDNDPAKIGKRIGEFTIQDTRMMAAEIHKKGIRIAMLTIPAEYAQSIANELVSAGVQAILNYAPIPITVPEHVRVEYINPILQLQHMTFYL